MERWKEEIILCQTDLECSERWFRHHAEVWLSRREEAGKNLQYGPQCYAAKQAYNFHRLQDSARKALADIKKVL